MHSSGEQMPFTTEKDGEQITVYTQKELDTEVAGLKVTLGQLKNEKADLKTKLGAVEAEKLDAEESYAKANDDKETLQRISEDRDTKTRGELDVLKASIRSEKTGNLINDFVTKHGAGSVHNEDLRDLLKSRFKFDYDMDTHEHRVAGENVTSMSDLEKVVKESGRYDAYLAGTGSTGGDSQGSTRSGGAVVNPFSKETFNLTAQADMLRDNPTLAEQLKRQS